MIRESELQGPCWPPRALANRPSSLRPTARPAREALDTDRVIDRRDEGPFTTQGS